MGMNVAVLAQAMEAKRRSMVRDLRNSMGKIRRLTVVRTANVCWRPKRMKRTPEVTKRAMMRALFQAKTTPPKFMAMTPETKAPQIRMAPT